MDTTLFLQYLRDQSLEEGRAYITAHITALADLDAIGILLADEALKQLYNPFLSLKLSELLIYLGDHTHHLSSHALGLKARGDALVQVGHYQAAIESLDAAGEEFSQLGDEGNWARTRISWIAASAWLGHVEEAIQHAARARMVFLRQDEPYWVCIIDHNTAVIYSHIGRYADALAMYERMLEIFPTLGDQTESFMKRSIAMAQVNKGLNLARLGKFALAYSPLQQAQESFISLGETSQVVNTEIHLAELDYIRGYYGSALHRYYQAQDTLMQHDVHIPALQAALKLQMASTLIKLNRVFEACALAQQAVELCRQPSASLPASEALREYAGALVASGRLQEAVVALNEAWELFNQGGFEHHALATKLQQAEIYLEMGNAAQAYAEARILNENFAARGLLARSVRAGLVMAGSLLEQAKQAQRTQASEHGEQQAFFIQEATSLCKQVALQAHQFHLQEEVYKSQYLLGQLYALQGDTARAIRHFAAAIAQIERILDDLFFDLTPSFLRTAWAVYEDMIALYLQQQQFELAFNYLERARSMALRQYLKASKTQFDGQGEPEETVSPAALQEKNAAILRLQYELEMWQESYRDYSVLLADMDTSVSPTVERGIIEAELKRCEAKLNELFERLYLYKATTSHSPYTPQVHKAEKRRANYLDIAQIRQSLSPNQLLLAYFLHKENLVIFAVTNEMLAAYENPGGAKQLKRLLPFLHAHLQPGGWPDPQQPPHQGVRLMLHKLYQLLIAPVQDKLPPQPGYLTIVPYGSLHTLPFHALYNGSRFLIEDYQVNYLPTSSLLQSPASIEIKRKTSTAATQPPLVFGYSGRGHLQRALEEARMLAALLGGRCYLEDEATIARLIEEAPGSPIIHLATHGHSRLDAPNFSSVLLADGRFNVIDAFSLNLNACELVTLSGCETGLALSGGGDEQLGLGRAFLAAGADTLVMSLWPVEDNATNELMQLFYENLLHGDSKAQALQKAQRSLVHQAESLYTHPYYWAAFRLVGDASPLTYQRAENLSMARKIDSAKE